MKISTKKLALCALLSALALALSWAESFLILPLPVPGMKLGLANIVTLYALYTMGFPAALSILLVRCTLGAFFAGSISSLLFSLGGGLLALAVMAILRKTRLSIYGVSLCGAAAHNIGQVLAALAVLQSAAPVGYLPILLILSLFTGALCAFCAASVYRATYRYF